LIQSASGEWNRSEDGQTFERLEQDLGGMNTRSIVWPVRANDELRLRAARYIRLKDAVRIVEVRNDDRKTRKEFLERFLQSAVAGKERRERSGFNRTNCVDQSPAFASDAM